MKKLLPILLLLTACSKTETPSSTASAPNTPIILISIDTLRADRLPAYGYRNVETPAIDAFRKEAILYANAYSHVPLTLPSHVSMLTGQLPPDTGVRNNIGFTFEPEKHPTLPGLLKAKGYTTGAAVSAYVLRGNTGLARIFDFYDDDITAHAGEATGRVQRPGEATLTVAERWTRDNAQSPFFFMLHLFEPHSPYAPPEPFRTKYADRLYDGEVAASDALVGRFLDHLRSSGIYDRAVIIILSDHGEGLSEHGEEEHGIFLYREAIHVPLLIKLPKSQRGGESVTAPVQLIDLLPTLTKLAGADTPQGLRGADLLAQLPASRRIYSETLYPRIHLGWSDLRSVVDQQFHYIDAPRPELYATTDVAERANVLADNRRVYAAMRKELEPFSRDLPTMSAIDPEEAKKLAALGYLASAPSASSGPLPDPKDRIGVLAKMKVATRLEREGKTLEAIASYREIIAEEPRLTDAWSLLARQLEKSGQWEEAVTTYKRGIELAPSSAGEFALSLANVYLLLNRPDDAMQHAQLGLSTNPGNAHILMGRSALAKNDLTRAESESREAMQSLNYRVPAMVLLAQVRVQQRDLRGAAALLDDAMREVEAKKLEVPPLVYFIRGDILARMNRPGDAIAAFEEEIRRYPNNRQAYANLAVIYLLSGRRDDANRTMERLVRANPSRTSYLLAAKTFAELGDNATAAQWERRAR
ncbi:MAG TPA: sulfatase-like hydrolase/transferase [Thermoanaerobaculia bacterium]|jgi:arylsulfatase A-like enzyme/Tfp pilus assembly protein PilF